MDIFKTRRSIRKYLQKSVPQEILEDIADCGRLSPSGANLQPLKFHIITNNAAMVFPYIKWAAYLPNYNPTAEDAPTSYIAIYQDTDIKENCELDAGIAGTAMIYYAESKGLSSCWLGAIDRVEISKILDLPKNLKLMYLIAFGYADQKSTVCEFGGSVKYKITDDGEFLVPKRAFAEVVSHD